MPLAGTTSRRRSRPMDERATLTARSDPDKGDMDRLITTINRAADEVSALQARIAPVLTPGIDEPTAMLEEIAGPQSALAEQIERINAIQRHLTRIRDYVSL
jgi:ABC-type transporter Mla subunit MlaD